MFTVKKIIPLLCYILATPQIFAQCPEGFNIGGENRAVNGDFSSGNTGFSSEYTYIPITDNSPVGNELYPEGVYAIWHSSQDLHNGFADCVEDNDYMIINGAETEVDVWRQTIPVEQNTLYYFVIDIASVHHSNPALLEFSVNLTNLGEAIKASSSTCSWKEFYATWYSGEHEEATISIVNRNTELAGNDFALNNIAFVPCEQILTPVELTDFAVSSENESVKITWITASEHNNDYFSILRSKDGINFTVIATVPSQNSNSSMQQSYFYYDTTPYNGVVYYKLKQTDFDGTYTTSKIISHTHSSNAHAIRLTHKNTKKETLVWQETAPENIDRIVIFSKQGQHIIKTKYEQEILIPDLTPGTYIMRILSKQQTFYNRLFKVD